MKAISFTARWLLIAMGTLNIAALTQPLALALETEAVVSGDVSTYLTLEETQHNWNDTLSLGLHFENLNQSEDLNVTSPDACYVDVEILDENGEVVSDDMSCAQVETSFLIREVEEKEWEVPLESLAGLPAGTYELVVTSRATVETANTQEVSSLIGDELRLSFELVGSLEVNYSLNKEEYHEGDTITVDYTITNQGSDDFDFEVGGCRPYITLYDVSTDIVVFDQITQGELACEDIAVDATVESQGTYLGSTTLSLADEGIETGRYRLGLSFDGTTPSVGSIVVAPFGSSEAFYVVGDSLFNDISFHWAKDYIEVLYTEGVVEGYGAEFKPDQAITRAELLKIIYAAQNLDVLSEEELSNSESYFTDVDDTDWSYSYVQSAYQDGTINGYEDNSFAPDQSITRAEAMSLLLLSVGYTEEQIASINPSNVFTDVTEDWQEKYILFAYHMGIVDGYHDAYGNATWEFGPNDQLTRAEACKIVLEARGVLDNE